MIESFEKKTVLIVDDDPDIRIIMRVLLSQNGYATTEAANGIEALEKLRTLPLPCLILLDMMMDEMDGWEFLEVRKTDPTIAAIPVLLVSAGNELNSLGEPFLSKSFEKEVFLDRVEKCAKRTLRPIRNNAVVPQRSVA